MRVMRRVCLTFALVVATVLGAGSARADAGSAAAAEALFAEGKKLVAEKRFAEACPKFAESQRLDAAAGTLLHLGDCYEQQGKLASAWATFLEAASAARAQGRADWEKLSRERAAKLEGILPKLSIRSEETADGLEIKRDGVSLTVTSLGVALPTDAGPHVVEVKAKGRKPLRIEITVAPTGTTEIKVPKLEAEASPVAGAVDVGPGPKTEEPRSSALPLIIGGVGVVGLGVGTVTGLMAMSANRESKAQCPEAGACSSQKGVDENARAQSLGTVSTIGFVAGAALLAAGVVLWATQPSRKKTGRAWVAPTVTAQGGGLAWGQTW